LSYTDTDFTKVFLKNGENNGVEEFMAKKILKSQRKLREALSAKATVATESKSELKAIVKEELPKNAIGVAEAAEMLGFSPSYAYKMSDNFGLKKYHVGREAFYDKIEIESLLKKNAALAQKVERRKKKLNIFGSVDIKVDSKSVELAAELLKRNGMDLVEHLENVIKDEIEEILNIQK